MFSKRSIASWCSVSAMALATVAIAGTISLSGQATAQSSMSGEMMIDPAKILTDTGVYGLFNTYKVQPSYSMVGMEARAMAAQEIEALIEMHKGSVLVQMYLTRGFEEESDFMFRIHAYEPLAAQAFLVDFAATELGRHSEITAALFGVTKALNHTTQEKSPELLDALRAGTYEADPPKYAFMIPIDKNAEWWNLSEEEKLMKMEEHTLPTLQYLVNVKRKLYHSTGLDDTDFITYFETADLVAFNDLNIALHSVSEMLYNTRYGSPLVMGAIMPAGDVVEALSK